jgi:hypothetical protein
MEPETFQGGAFQAAVMENARRVLGHRSAGGRTCAGSTARDGVIPG